MSSDNGSPGGWFAVWRAWIYDETHPDHPVNTGEVVCSMMAWIYLIGLAHPFHEPSEDGLKRGQLRTSSRALARAWNWSYRKVDEYLRGLEAARSVERITSVKGGRGQVTTVLTIVNFETYQPPGAGGKSPARSADANGSGSLYGSLPRPVDNRVEKSRNGSLPNGEKPQRRGRSSSFSHHASGSLPEPPKTSDGGGIGGSLYGSPKKVEGTRAREEVDVVVAVGVGVSADLPASAVESGHEPKAEAGRTTPNTNDERRRAAELIVTELHLGTPTISVGGHRIGVPLELRTWDAMVQAGTDPEELNGALSVFRSTPDALDGDLQGQPVTMALLKAQPGLLALLIGQWYKLDDG